MGGLVPMLVALRKVVLNVRNVIVVLRVHNARMENLHTWRGHHNQIHGSTRRVCRSRNRDWDNLLVAVRNRDRGAHRNRGSLRNDDCGSIPRRWCLSCGPIWTRRCGTVSTRRARVVRVGRGPGRASRTPPKIEVDAERLDRAARRQGCEEEREGKHPRPQARPAHSLFRSLIKLLSSSSSSAGALVLRGHAPLLRVSVGAEIRLCASSKFVSGLRLMGLWTRTQASASMAARVGGSAMRVLGGLPQRAFATGGGPCGICRAAPHSCACALGTGTGCCPHSGARAASTRRWRRLTRCAGLL